MAFTRITKDNLPSLIEDKYHILIAGIWSWNSWGKLDYWDTATIDIDGSMHSERGHAPNGWQTGWEKDKEFRIFPKTKPSKDIYGILSMMFTGLDLGSHVLESSFQAAQACYVVNREVFSAAIPINERPMVAFEAGLKYILPKIKNNDLRGQLPKMLDYIARDLEDGKDFRANVQAGMDADTMLGMGADQVGFS